MKLTYFLDIFSSWCYWVEPAWAELKTRYAGRVAFEWKIALMKPDGFPVSREQCDWFYRRSGLVMQSPFMLNSGWLEPERKGIYPAANLVAEAGRDFGFTDDRLRLALMHGALREGRRLGDFGEVVAVGAKATGINADELRARAMSAEVARRVGESTALFHSLQVTQRPAFLLENPIGDRAIFSGMVKIAPLAVAIDTMLADTAAYEAHKAHFGAPPAI